MQDQQNLFMARATMQKRLLAEDLAIRIAEVQNEYKELVRRLRIRDKPIWTQKQRYISALETLWQGIRQQVRRDDTFKKIDRWLTWLALHPEADIDFKYLRGLHQLVFAIMKRDGIYDFVKKELLPEEFWRQGL